MAASYLDLFKSLVKHRHEVPDDTQDSGRVSNLMQLAKVLRNLLHCSMHCLVQSLQTDALLSTIVSPVQADTLLQTTVLQVQTDMLLEIIVLQVHVMSCTGRL